MLVNIERYRPIHILVYGYIRHVWIGTLIDSILFMSRGTEMKKWFRKIFHVILAVRDYLCGPRPTSLQT